MGLDVPRTYDEFFAPTYRSWCAHLLRTLRVPYDDVENALQELMFDFWVGDYLRIYDPAKGSFDTFLYAFVERRSRHVRMPSYVS